MSFRLSCTALLLLLGVYNTASQTTCGRPKSADPMRAIIAQFTVTTTIPSTVATTARTNPTTQAGAPSTTGAVIPPVTLPPTTRATSITSTAAPTSQSTAASTSTSSTSRSSTTTNRPYYRGKRNALSRIKESEQKIVGGVDVTDLTGGQLCWQIFLQKQLNGQNRGYCGGTIVGQRTVITAAHCVVTEPQTGFIPDRTSDYFVVTGASGVNTQTFDPVQIAGCSQRIKVQSFTTHPSYDAVSGNDDLAVLVLSESIDLTRQCACSACLEDTEPKVGELCAASGYGETRDLPVPKRVIEPLKWTFLNVLQQGLAPCSNFDNARTDTSKNVCGGDPTSSVCFGDSGGPFVCWDPERTQSYYLAGVPATLTDPNCFGATQFTKVSRYFQWIVDNSGGFLRIA